MNSSLYSMDRVTHLKIAVVALFAALVIAAASVGAHIHTMSRTSSVSGIASRSAHVPAPRSGAAPTYAKASGAPVTPVANA